MFLFYSSVDDYVVLPQSTVISSRLKLAVTGGTPVGRNAYTNRFRRYFYPMGEGKGIDRFLHNDLYYDKARRTH